MIPSSKDDLSRFYVNEESASGTDYLYLAWERSNTNGTATIDFELNQGTAPSANGVTPQRTPGDLLVTFDFNGGSAGEISVRTWQASGSWSSATDLSASGFAEASVNTINVTDNNPPNNPTTLVANQFGEAAINLTAHVFPQATCENFGSAFAKSRSSSFSFGHSSRPSRSASRTAARS